jgi:hypothetical protein
MHNKIKKGGQRAASKLSPIPFRVTEEEREQIWASAEQVGLTVSAFIRACILEETPKMRATRRPSVEAEILARLLGQMGKVTGDIQELAKKVGPKNSKAEKDALKTLKDVRATVSAIMEALGRKPHDY